MAEYQHLKIPVFVCSRCCDAVICRI